MAADVPEEETGVPARYVFAGHGDDVAALELTAICVESEAAGLPPTELADSMEFGAPYMPDWSKRLSFRYERGPRRGYVFEATTKGAKPKKRDVSDREVEGHSAELMIAIQRLAALGARTHPTLATSLAGVYAVGEFEKLRGTVARERLARFIGGDSSVVPADAAWPVHRARNRTLLRRFGRYLLKPSSQAQDDYKLRNKLNSLKNDLQSSRLVLIVPAGDLHWLSEFPYVRRDDAIDVTLLPTITVRVVPVRTLADAIDAALGERANVLATDPSDVVKHPWILVATLSLGSGELIWWPYLAAKYGLPLITILMSIAAAIQWPINYAVGCHALGLKETSLVSFYRTNRWFGLFMYVAFALAFLTFTTYAYIVGGSLATITHAGQVGSSDDYTRSWAVAAIFTSVGAYWLGKRIPKLFKLLGGVALLTATILIVDAISMSGPWRNTHPASASGLWHEDFEPFVAAVIFMGLGGFWNLLYSVWVIDANDDAAILAYPHELKRRIRADTTLGLGINYLITLLLCFLASARLELPGAGVGISAANIMAGWRLSVYGYYGYLLLVAAFLWDTLHLTAQTVSAMHVQALRAISAERGAIGRIATDLTTAFGDDGRRGAYFMYLASFVVVVVTFDRVLARLPQQVTQLSAYVMLLSAPLCCVGLVLLSRRGWLGADPRAIGLRPGSRTIAALVAVMAIYAIFICALIFH